jgi:hypothetical protein
VSLCTCPCHGPGFPTPGRHALGFCACYDNQPTATCGQCSHAQPVISDDESEGPILKCHRYPPTLFVLDGEVTQAFPDAVDACGEWSA